MEIHKPKFIKGLIAEMFIIVVSIILAVSAERWVEHLQHQKESKGVMHRMIAELRRDSADLAFNITYHNKAAVADSVLTRWSRKQIELTEDTVAYHAGNSLNYTFFASNTTEIEAMKGSGKLFLIENEELLSTILKHYDRYQDFKLFTDITIRASEALNNIYQSSASLNANIDFSSNATVYQFNGSELMKNLRGNRAWENKLQEKRVMDEFMLNRTQGALKRTITIMNTLREEMAK